MQSLYVAAKLPWREGSPVKQIQIDGGQAVVSEAFIENVRALLETTEQTGVGSGEGLFLPSVQVRNFRSTSRCPATRNPILAGSTCPCGPRDHRGQDCWAGSPAGDKGQRQPRRGLPVRIVEPSGGLELHALADELDVEAWDISALVPWIPLESLGAKASSASIPLASSLSLEALT